jgi:hypothetical protein
VDLTTVLAFSASIAFFMIDPSDELSRRYGMFKMVLSDALEEATTAPTTVTNKTCLIQDIVSDMNQSKILPFFQCVEQFLNRCSSAKSLLDYKIGGST